MELPAGYVLSHEFEIERLLEQDDLGCLYAAVDRGLGISVVIKEFLPHGQSDRAADFSVQPRGDRAAFDWAKQRYLKEAQALARFKHDAIWRVYRVLETNGTVYGIYEAVDGPTLQSWLRDLGRPPTQAEIDALAAPLLDGLTAIHQGGLIHRQIGPETIRLRSSNNAPVLVDFSSAQHRNSNISAALTHDPFTPIEMQQSDLALIGPWTDIYRLAATLHFVITGKPPDSPFDAIVTERRATLGSKIPAGRYRPSFLNAIDQALAPNPKNRPQSVAEWRAALLPQLPGHDGAIGTAVGTKVFVSYRRADTAHLAGRIYDHLEDAFGRDEVFFDVEAIPPGVNFKTYIDTRMRQSAVVLALIGPNWLRQPTFMQRMLGRGTGPDHVMLEIEIAMRHGVPVIPVLVDGAAMPGEANLPPSIRSLSSLNAMTIRGGADFRADIGKAIAVAKSLKAVNAGEPARR